jgi:hypothetical protein
MNTKAMLFVPAVLSLSVLICGCSGITQGTNAAKAQIVVFHQQFNAGQFDAIVSSADPQLYKGTEKSKVVDLLFVVNRKLGKVKSTKTISWRVQSFNLDTMVYVQQDTQFDTGTGTESFVYRIANNKALLVGYHIDSQDLIMR